MSLPFKVVDADGHLVEDQARIKEYMDPPYSEFLIDNMPDKEGRVGHGSALTNRGFSDSTMGGRKGSQGPAGYPFPNDWLEALELGDMEMTFLFPTILLTYGTIWDPDYLKAVTRAYNNWVAEEWLKVSPRLKAVSLMPLSDVEESIKELRRTVTELGFSGVMVPAVGFGGLGDRKFDPFYQEAQHLGCLIAVHGGTDEYMKYTKFIQRHTTAFPISNMLQVVHMIYGGVFERYPTLRIGYLETGCTWVPFFLDRMDEEWEKRGWLETPDCVKKPSEYLKSERVFFHAEPSESLVPQVIEVLGEDTLFYASDWPHWDNEYPQNIQQFWDRDDISESAKKKILSDNCKAMYGVNGAA
ncbi:MAG: amidohydrolase family protein [Dehalococcoidia bacterium]